MQHEKFYLVWCDGGGIPTAKHLSHSSACNEAERLAKNNSGKVFHVLECVTSVRRSDMVWSGEMPVPF